MRIGELAKKTNCKEVTIRFYEKKGLMPPVERTRANYRNYGEKDLERLAFIRHCRSHGMTLEDIEKLLHFLNNDKISHEEIHEMIKSHITTIQRQIAELNQLQSSLQVLLENCSGKDRNCGILTNLCNRNLCSGCSVKTSPD